MTNEWVPKGGPYETQDFTVLDAKAFEKGTPMVMVTPRTASGAKTAEAPAANQQPYFAGVTMTEKVASDGQTRLGLCQTGIWDVVASGAIIMGHALMIASGTGYPNTVCEAAATASGAAIIGYALEGIADAATGEIRLNIGAGNAIT